MRSCAPPRPQGHDRARSNGQRRSLREAPTNREVISWSEFKGNEVARAGAQSLADVIPRNDEVAPVVSDTSNDHVDMGVFRVPVIDGNPIELGSEISLRLRHQIPREGLQVGQLLRIVGRHDETKVMAIGTPLGERPWSARRFRHRTCGQARRPRDAVAAQVFEMGTERRSLDPAARPAP
jgi:hypothetical protein